MNAGLQPTRSLVSRIRSQKHISAILCSDIRTNGLAWARDYCLDPRLLAVTLNSSLFLVVL